MKNVRKVFVAGPVNAARGAVIRRLKAHGLNDNQIDAPDENELNISDQAAVRAYLHKSMPSQIVITAGPWGNPDDSLLHQGSYMADALLGPVLLIHEALYAGVKKLLFMASHKVYGACPVLPIAEEDLTYARYGPLSDPTSIAHAAGIRLCEAYTLEFGEGLGVQYRSVVVGNLYGPGDCLEASKAGELQALMRHIHQAKRFKLSSVSIRSSGLRRADWLYVDDMADACIQVLGMKDLVHQKLTRPRQSQLNLGSGFGYSTLELARAVASVVGYKGELYIESDLEDSQPDLILDTYRMRSVGWRPQVALDQGLALMYRDYRQRERKLASA